MICDRGCAPVFGPQTVTISTAAAGATIRYTLDGTTTPTETIGTVGTSVAIGSSVTLKAIAYKIGSGMTDSPVTSSNYTIGPEVVSPPSAPSGPTSVGSGISVTYGTGGATDSYGNPVQYPFYWGDGSNAGWLPIGTVSASHSWSSTGTQLNGPFRGVGDGHPPTQSIKLRHRNWLDKYVTVFPNRST